MRGEVKSFTKALVSKGSGQRRPDGVPCEHAHSPVRSLQNSYFCNFWRRSGDLLDLKAQV